MREYAAYVFEAIGTDLGRSVTRDEVWLTDDRDDDVAAPVSSAGTQRSSY